MQAMGMRGIPYRFGGKCEAKKAKSGQIVTVYQQFGSAPIREHKKAAEKVYEISRSPEVTCRI
jgi:cell wall-associated NlpC family hydrolase